MKAFLITLLLAFSLFTLFSCRKNNSVNSSPVDSNPDDTSSIHQIWPLQLGNTWILRYTGLDTGGNILSSRYDTLLVLRDTLFSRQDTTYYYEVSGRFGGWLGNNSGSINMVIGSYGSYVSTGRYWYPAGVGTQYYDKMMGDHYIYVQSTDTVLAVPQGTHRCYEYEYVQLTDSLVHRKDFLSPGIGPVQIEMYDYIDTSSYRLYCSERWQLYSVTLK